MADAHGDIARGLDVVEFAAGVPHLLKGEFSDNAGAGIDVHSLRRPLGVVAGITPFNFPAMIPLWKAAPALACGNAFILKPSERDPSVPLRLAELFLEAGLPPGVLNVVNGGKEAVDTLLEDPRVKALGFVGSTPIAAHIYATAAAHGKRAQCFGGAKNHMIVMPDADLDQAVDALIGAGYGSAGERCMAISVAVPVGEATADALVARLTERIAELRIGRSDDPDADFGPLVGRDAVERVRGYVDLGVEEGAELVVDGRDFTLEGHEDGFFAGASLFDRVTPDMRIYQEEIFGPVVCVVRAADYEEALRLPSEHPYGNGVALFTRDGDTARDFTRRVDTGMVGVNVPSRCRWRTTRSAAGSGPASGPQPARSGRDPLLHPDEDRHLALARLRDPGRCELHDPDHGVSAVTTLLTDDQLAVVETTLDFAQEHLAPHAVAWDQDKHFPVDVLRKAAGLGLGGVYVREDVGGSELSRTDGVLVFEALATGCPSIAGYLSIHNMVGWMVDRYGTEAQRERYLPRLCAMELLGSYCLTEPGAGSDAAALRTRAVRDGDAYVLTGTKQFISGAGASHLYIVLARTGGDGPRGISAFLVERDDPGLSFGPNEKKMGWNAQPTRQVVLDGVRVRRTGCSGTRVRASGSR